MRSFYGYRLNWIPVLFLLGMVISMSSCAKKEEVMVTEIMTLGESGRINKIFFADDTEAYVMGGDRWKQGFLYHSTDGGKSWNIVDAVRDTSDFWLTDMAAISQEERVCVGYGGQVFYSADQGHQWSFLRSLEYEAFEAVAPKGDGTYLLGGGALFFRGDISYSQPGQWWNLQRDTFPIKINNIHIAPSGNTIVGGYGSVYVQSDVNSNWQRTRMSGDIFTDIHFPSEDIGFACGFNGSIWRIDKEVSNPVNLISTSPVLGKVRSWHDIHFYDELHGAVVGAGGDIWWTHDGGDHWEAGTLNRSESLFAIHMVSANEALVGGESGYFVKVTLP